MKEERSEYVGVRYCMRRRISLSSFWTIQRQSALPSPALWVSKSRTVICDSVYASLILNPGKMSDTLSFHFNFPSSTSMPTQTAVIALVVEAQIDKVVVSKADDLPNSVTP